ncbi:MAG: hypothetical protein GX892_05880 [Thermoanaerobacteraceae bacterium]|nr:hypothetical protein [Thermoanaerobacteraceae bacterium]
MQQASIGQNNPIRSATANTSNVVPFKEEFAPYCRKYSWNQNFVHPEMIITHTQLASGSEQGGDSPMAEQYFDKFLDQRFASIDEKISSIKWR